MAPGQAVSGWTIDTAMAHLVALIEANDRRYAERHEASQAAVQAALAAQKEAVLKAETASERRFEGVNEFRATLADQQAMLMPRAESLALHDAQRERSDALRQQMDTKHEQSAEGIRANKAQIDKLISERQGIKGGWGYAVGVIGFIAALISLFVTFRGT